MILDKQLIGWYTIFFEKLVGSFTAHTRKPFIKFHPTHVVSMAVDVNFIIHQYLFTHEFSYHIFLFFVYIVTTSSEKTVQQQIKNSWQTRTSCLRRHP